MDITSLILIAAAGTYLYGKIYKLGAQESLSRIYKDRRNTKIHEDIQETQESIVCKLNQLLGKCENDPEVKDLLEDKKILIA